MTAYLPLEDQIRVLFDVVRHPEGRPYTLQEVSEQIDVSLATISQMRSGRIKNPQLHTLRELCRFFDVPLHYFETRTVEACYAVSQANRPPIPPIAHQIAVRAARLSPAAQQDVLVLIRWVQAAEAQQHRDPGRSPLPHLEAFDEQG